MLNRLFNLNFMPIGFDGFKPDEAYGYVEATAAYGRAAVALDNQVVAAECYYSLPSGNNWGLPWDWAIYNDQARIVPAGSGFVTTTCDVLNFMMDYEKPVDASWLLATYPSYGEHPNAQTVIYNAVAQADATLKRAGYITASEAAIYQTYKGLYPYSEERPFAFEYHQPMILDALIDMGTPVDVEPYFYHFFDSVGRGYTMPDGSNRTPMPVRFMALSALVFEKSGYGGYARRVADVILNQYVSPMGIITHVPNGKSFIREAAQALSALARLERVS